MSVHDDPTDSISQGKEQGIRERTDPEFVGHLHFPEWKETVGNSRIDPQPPANAEGRHNRRYQGGSTVDTQRQKSQQKQSQ